MTEKSEITFEDKKVITPEFRVSFPSVFQPKSFLGSEPKFSVTMLFPKNTDLKDLKRAAHLALIEKFGPKEKWPKNLKNPFRDGDEMEDMNGFEGMIFVRASAKERPGLVDRRANEILDPSDFYAGCYARASVVAFGYKTAGNQGASFALLNLQKTRDGDSLTGKRRAQDEFDAIEDDEYESESVSDIDDALGF